MSDELSDELKLECAIDLMRRLPPQHVSKNLADLIDLVPDLCEDILSSIDQPLKVARDKENGKDYLLCDYNRDGDSYRSPWSNNYDPPTADGTFPSERLRRMEIEANDVFDTYRELYYEGGICSVYLMDLSADSFVFTFAIKKAGDTGKIRGCWDSFHVMQVKNKGPGLGVTYKLISTVMLWLQTVQDGSGTMDLGGSIVRQTEEEHSLSNDEQMSHIINIGRMIEDMENRIRSQLNAVYFGKTKDILNDLRSVNDLESGDEKFQLAAELQLKLKTKK